MKDLLFVIDSLNSGGAEKSLVNLLNEIDYSQYNVDLQLFSINNFLIDLLPEQVNVLPIPEYFKHCSYSLRELMEKRKVKMFYYRIKTSAFMRIKNTKRNHILQTQWECMGKCIERNQKQYDVAIAYSQGMPTYYVVEKVSAFKKIAWINCLYSNTNYNKCKDFRYYNTLHKLVVVSEKSKEDFVSVFPTLSDRVNVIYDFISKKVVDNMANENFEWKDGFRGIRIASILRFEWVKGPDIVVECCKKMRDRGIPFRWYLIGREGSMSKEITDRIKNYSLENDLILLGPQLNPFKFVNNCDIYVQASRVEGYCMALAEAKMLNVGIVSTNFLLVQEHIVDGLNGCICDANPESMFQKILYMINNPEFTRYTIKNREQQIKDYNKEICKFYSVING